jgi:hypothetical protein
MSKFNDFRFEGLDYQAYSNKYATMNRVSENGDKIVMRVADSHLLKTRYGWAFIIDAKHVIFLKDWNVNCNYYQNEVLFDRNYFVIKEWGYHPDFDELDTLPTFDDYKAIAQEQQDAKNAVEWAIKGSYKS